MTSLRIPISQVDLLIAQGASRKQMQRVCIVVTHEPCRARWRWPVRWSHGGLTRYHPVYFLFLWVTTGYKMLQNSISLLRKSVLISIFRFNQVNFYVLLGWLFAPYIFIYIYTWYSKHIISPKKWSCLHLCWSNEIRQPIISH